MKKTAAFALSFFLTTGVVFADSAKDTETKPEAPTPKAAVRAPAKPPAADPAAIAAELDELRQALKSQQEQIQLLKEELAKRDRQIGEVRDAAVAADAHAEEASAKVAASTAALSSTVNDLKASNEVLRTTVAAEAAQAKSEEGPASFKFKGITFTPGGFLAAESVYRSRATSADINTPFTAIPFGGNSLSRVSEFNASGRQSRLSFLFEGNADKIKMTGYYELDWLGACATSNNRQSNSYCMRQRQIWGQAALPGGWTFTGGQMWSLATETKKGMENRTEAPPMTIDPQYSVGFTWARQYGFRVVKYFDDKKFALGLSVEGPQTTLGGRGFPTNFFINAPGNGGGLFNATDGTGYTVNMTPDFIVKATADPGWGHYELFGVISTFRQRLYPCATASAAAPCAIDGSTAPSAVGAFNDSRTGGGIGANIRVPLFNKKLDAGLHFLGGSGVGRYGSASLADVTARPDGTLALIRGGQTLGTLEFHPTPMLDVYLNYGLEYAFRTAYLNASGAPVGYGSPFFNNSGCDTERPPTGTGSPSSGGTCQADVRNIQEATLGFWHRFYKGPKGTLQWGLQYSYLVKNTWSGNNNTPTAVGLAPKAIDNLFLTSFRYVLP